MKNKIFLLVYFIPLVLFFISVISFINVSNEYENLKYTIATASELPEDFDKLIEEEYGKSLYRQTIDGITIDLIRIIDQKKYIKYSWFNSGDNNTIIIIDIQTDDQSKLEFDKDFQMSVVADGKTILPYYKTLLNYPLDDPLVYKKSMLGFFEQIKADKINIKVVYLDKVFELKDIDNE